MESNLQKCLALEHPSDYSDAEYISGLSTVLVATIQETKDRISQIEYIFCSQLYPNFQLNPRSLQKVYSEGHEGAEDAYKQKEKDLLLQIEKLRCQNQQALEENQSLKLEKKKITDMERQSFSRVEELQKELNQKTMEASDGMVACQNLQKLLESKSSLLHSYEMTIGKLEEKNAMLLKMQKKLDVGTEELKQELMQKSKDFDEIVELQNKLFQINQANSSLIVQKDAQLKEGEGKINLFVCKLANMENKADEMLSVLKKGKELQVNLLQKIESQSLEIMNHEKKLNKYEKENTRLATEVEKKSLEMEEVKKGQQQLLKQSDSSNVERVERGRPLEEFTEEKKRLLDKQKGVENEVGNLEQFLSERIKEFSEGMELHEKLLQQIEVKDSSLAQKRKNRDVITASKKLKSPHKYLLKKCDLTPETGLRLDEMEDESEIIRCNQTPVTSREKYEDMPVPEDNRVHNLGAEENEDDGMPSPPPHASQKHGCACAEPAASGRGRGRGRASKPQAPTFAVHFTKVPKPGGIEGIHFKAICNYCNRKYEYTKRGGHGSLNAHTKNVHPIEWGITSSHFSNTTTSETFGVTSNTRLQVMENTKASGIAGDVTKPLGNHQLSKDKKLLISYWRDAISHQSCMEPDSHDDFPDAGKSGFKYVGSEQKKSESESLKGAECKKFYDAILLGSGDEQNICGGHHEGVL